MFNQEKREFTAWTFLWIAATLIAAAAFAVGGFYIYRWVAPREESVRRETFEQSKAYNQGMQQDLQKLAFEYAKADDAHKPMIASVILQRTADYDTTQLTPELQTFIHELRAERMGVTP